MTTPGAPNTLTDNGPKLGDFTQEQIGPTVAAFIWSGQQGSQLTLANQDLVNSVTIARRNNFIQNGSNTAVIPPLGSITVDGSRSIWALAPTGTAPLLIFPGGGNWAPSPAQVAAQINALGLAKDTSVNAPAYSPITTANAGLLAKDSNILPLAKDTSITPLAKDTTVASTITGIPNNIATTGTPLLLLNNNLQNTVNATLGAGATVNSAVLVLNQPSYHVFFAAKDNAAGTTQKTITITLTWTDSTTGAVVQIDTYNIMPASTGAASAHTVVGDGPTKGNNVQISITNNDTVAITYSFTITQDSRVFQRDLWRSTNNPAPTGFSTAGSNLPGLILLDTSPTVANGATQTRSLPLWTGQCSISAVPGSGASGSVIYQIWSSDPTAVNWQRPYSFIVSSGSAVNNTSIILPNAQCWLSIVNNGTGSAVMGAWITCFEQ